MQSSQFNHAKAALALGFVLTLSAISQAQDSTLDVRLKAATCASCHGFEGRSIGVGLPLAGQPEETLFTKLVGFRNGTLQGTVMPKHVKAYTDAELRSLARYFSRIK